jgi:Na+/proline symporter
MFSNFSILDIVIMTVYLSGLVILGIYLKKKAAGSIKEYFLGGNKIPWWAMGISGMASQLDMTGTMVIVSLLYMFGSRGMYIEIRGGLVLIMAFAMVFMGKWNYRSKCMTVAEWMEYRFGKGFPGESARILQAFAVIVMTVGMLAMFVKGSGLFLSLFLPFSPMVCAIIMFSIATIYTAISGFYGVVFTDIFQAIFILVASIAVSFLAYNKVVDNATFSQIAEQVTRNKDWMSTAIPAHIDMPEAYSIFEKFALAISFYVLLTVFTGMSKSGGRPMYFGARDERECGTLSFVWILASAIRWPMIIGFVILGIFFVKDYFSDPAVVQQAVELVKSHIPDIPEHSWNEKIESIISVPGQYPVQLIEGSCKSFHFVR